MSYMEPLRFSDHSAEDGACKPRWSNLFKLFEGFSVNEPQNSSQEEAELSFLQPEDRARVQAAIQQIVSVASADTIARMEDRMQLAQEVGAIGCFEIDLRDGTSAGTPTFFKLYGFEDRQGRWSQQEWLSFIHPDDKDRVLAYIADIIRGSELANIEYRVVRADGEVRWTASRARLEKSDEGRPRRAYGIQQDITERKLAELALLESEQSLKRLFEQALVGIIKVDRRGHILAVNQRFAEILRRPQRDLLGTSLAEYTHPEDLRWNLRLLRKHRRHGEPFHAEKRFLRPGGEVVWAKVNVSFELGSDNRVGNMIVIAEDITERVAADKALRESEVLHRSVLEASTDCIKILSLDGIIEFMNRAGADAMELECPDQVIGRKWVDLWPNEGGEVMAAAVEAAGAGENIRCTGFCPTTKGAPKWWDVSVTPMPDADGSVSRILAISRDVTLQRKTAENLKWASEHDALTELPNRRAFESHLQGAIIRAMSKGREVGLLLLDLDHFKHVNDTLGHAAGDQLLKVFSRRLRESVRINEFVARLGGDEFAIILEDDGRGLDLVAAGNSITTRIQEPVRYGDRLMSAGVSIGGAVYPNDASCANELLKNADTALYALKRSGRGGTRMFHQHMREHAQLVSSQLSLARSALTRYSVEPHYQPKINLADGKIAGWEALLRWRHATRGLQHPETIAEAFKEYELASKIGDLMQRKVFADAQKWLKEGHSLGFVALNAAPAEFLRDDFAERLLSRMREHKIPPSLIEIEVTEHVFLDDASDYVGRALKVLSSHGVRIALDDFGTGYSSLSHLRDYPVDVVKIDRSFVAKITTDSQIRAIVCAVIDLSQSLNIEVVAEGVETEEQRAILAKKECLMGQGFLFGRPVEADEVPLVLSGRKGRLRAA